MRGRVTGTAVGAVPEPIPPMLAAPGEMPDGDGWAVEFAWEGLRCLAYAVPGRLRLLTAASDRDVTGSFPELVAPLTAAAPRRGLVLDGTVVAIGDTGFPRRNLLQARSATTRPSEALLRRTPVGFFVGDLLAVDGRPTVDLPYHRRRELLAGLGLDTPPVVVSPSFPLDDVGYVLRAAEQHGVDALHAKHLDAPYRPGRRSRAWLRVPLGRSRQVVVGGWTPADPLRPDSVGALLLGVPGPDGLRYVGRAGLGSAPEHRELAALLPRLGRLRSPFDGPLPAAATRDGQWAAPQVVGLVEFAGWTADGRMRMARWRGVLPAAEVDAQGWARPPAVRGGGPAAQEPPAGRPAAPDGGTGAGVETGAGSETGVGAGTAPETGAGAGTAPETGAGTAAAETDPAAETGSGAGAAPETDPAAGTGTATGTGAEAATGAETGTGAGTAAAETDPAAETGTATGNAPGTGTATGTGTGAEAANAPGTGTAAANAPGTGTATGTGARAATGAETGTAAGSGRGNGTGPAARPAARSLEQHFVYNSMNTIASLVRTDPNRARELLLGFADLARAADRPSSALTTLGDELAAVRAYLQIEQARFGRRLTVQVDVDAALHAVPVPPLAVLAAVRETVQERIEPRPGGGTLTVRAEPAADGCVVRVTDEGAGEPIVITLSAAPTP